MEAIIEKIKEYKIIVICTGLGLLVGGFLNLWPAKNMSKQPFFEKMSGLRIFLEVQKCKAHSNSVSEIAENTNKLPTDPRFSL